MFALLVANERAPAFGAKHQMNYDVADRLRHDCRALTGLLRFCETIFPALQAGLSHYGLSARNREHNEGCRWILKTFLARADTLNKTTRQAREITNEAPITTHNSAANSY
jgi:hypothetical protein